MKKYVLAGTSGRGLHMFIKPMISQFREQVNIVGMFDVNQTRMNYVNKTLNTDIPVYMDFDLMMKETNPDVVIITTVDRFHHDYIIRALDYGCDVISEKPLTTDEMKVREILKAKENSPNHITVTFNYRFTPYVTRIKQLLLDGVIGNIRHVDFEYLLDRNHGADYYRRWHRKMENSGGLLVHKSTHHFDLVNWWLNQTPVDVYANGKLSFYGDDRKEKGIRCSTCAFADSCEFFVDYIHDEYYREFYFKAEHEDGYYRDRCVFDQEIDIYDTMSVGVTYDQGTLLTYSLTSFNPYEGWKVSFLGDKGRMEASEYHSGDKKDLPYYELDIYDVHGKHSNMKIDKAKGDHGGGDSKLRSMLFNDNIPDPLHHMADLQAGINSVMIGISANKSIREGKKFVIKELL
ncbi:MAG: Gfo/Idh/MocA family oxidoreductase [Clostridia bacterium]|nr:Gfo/Idh/MocA family oxidoreductase [Clostridia bacterium]